MNIQDIYGFEGADVVSIPLKCSGDDDNGQECIDIHFSELPPVDDVIILLRDEMATAELWHRVALLYHRKGDSKSFLQIADEGYRTKQTLHKSDCKESSVVPLLLSIGGYFYMLAAVNVGDSSRMDKLLAKVANCYSRAESLGVEGYEAEFYVGQAYYYMLTGEHGHADKHFSFILSTFNPKFVPAIVGRALLSFFKKNYTAALQHFRLALQLDPNGPINVRVGIGHCFWKLNRRDKAKLAYERAVELYPKDHNAVSALATLYLSTMNPAEVMIGVGLLVRAHSICPSHPATQLLLADHYYYKKEFDKSLDLALEVCRNTHVEEIRKRSAYLAGRCFQAKEDFKFAMHYYYEAVGDNGFLLPYFGLAQSYLHLNDAARSADALLKLLVYHPNNRLAMKMLGFLECTSEDRSKRERAQKNLKCSLDSDPDDVWTRLSLAYSLECVDDVEARENYLQALTEMKSRNLEVDPEIHNNLGCTLFRLKQYVDARNHFEMAVELTDLCLETGKNCRPLMTTLNFNIARTREALNDYGTAETIYKEILKKHPSYYSCFIRLAVIYRDRNNLYEAYAYFKEALQCSLEHPDVWAYIGNLHLAQDEIIVAQKKFLRILTMNESLKRDFYSLIALGNIEMIKFHKTNVPVESQLRYMKKSADYYQAVLERDPNNLWAANGIGCVLAAKGLFTDAREVFSQVRECAHDFKDVWINIGNTYLEQQLYFNAIQMYERCSKRFSVNTDCNLLQYLAKAYFYNRSYEEAKTCLLKCLRVAPYDKNVLFALAKTLRKIGWKPFQSQSRSSEMTSNGLKYLRQAKKFFESLSRKQSNPSELINAAAVEVQHCDDLIRQTPHMISKIEADYQKEQNLKTKREKEVNAFKKKQRQEKVLRDQQKKHEIKEAQKRREAVKKKIEKVKQTLENESVNEKKKRGKRTRKDTSEEPVDTFVVSDNDEGVADVLTTIMSPTSSVRKPKRKRRNISKTVPAERLNVHSPVLSSNRPKRRKKKPSSKVLVIHSDSSEGDIPVEKAKVYQKAPLSPDITDITRIPAIFKRARSVTPDEMEDEASTKDEDENMLYLEIFTGSNNQPASCNDYNSDPQDIVEDGGEQECKDLSSPCIYDDLPPVLSPVKALLVDEDSLDLDIMEPPVLRSIHSDNCED